MGFRVDMSPLERSSMNIGRSLMNIGQAVADVRQQDQQAQQQGDIEAFMRQAMDGDEVALKELMVKSPQAAQMVAQHIQSQQTGQQAEQSAYDTQIANDTAGFIEQMHLAPQEQQEAMFNAAIDDPRFDIDEDDRNSFMDVNARKAIIGQVKGKEYADNFFGGETEPMTEYQREMVKGNAIDRDLRKAELENKKIDNKIKTETNKVKLEELKSKKIANEEKQFQIKKAKSDTAQTVVDSGRSTLELISSIENHPGFESAVGAKGVSSLFGAVEPFSGTEAAGVNALIETLEAQNFLTAIGEFKSAGGAGSLSDNEGKKLGAALSNLSASQSEKDFKKSLTVIKNLVKKQVSKARPQISKRFTLDPTQGEQKSDTLSDEDLLNKYGG